MFGFFLRSAWLRAKLGFELQCWDYACLGVEVPLGNGVFAPVVDTRYWYSLSEVFFCDEYWPIFDLIDTPVRWLDLGCHGGFFSLLVLAKLRREKFNGRVSALLIDGDSRVRKSVETVIARNNLEGQFQFVHGAIAQGSGDIVFQETSVMSSCVGSDSSESNSAVRRVPVVTPLGILKEMPGPYDLVKIDVEGGEHDFLTAYLPVLEQTRHLILEWHSWHSGGGGEKSIREAASNAGFVVVKEIVAAHPISDRPDRSTGVILFKRLGRD